MQNTGGRLDFATSIDNAQLRAGAQESRRILSSIGKTAVQEGAVMDNTFKMLGKTIAGTFTVAAITSFARQVVSIRGEMESLRRSFEVLAGVDLGGKLFSDIKDFALRTPMMMKDLAKGAQTMLAFNIEGEKIMPLLRAIGDISMGDAGKFNSLTLAFSQMSATGRLMGQDLLQMINAGFNPLAVISEQTGKSIGKLKKEMEGGAISTEMVTQAFMKATSAGGKFYGMLGSMSQTTEGAISNLQGAWEDMLNAIGERAQGVISNSLLVATDIVKNYEKLGRILIELIATFGVYKAALLTLNTIEKIRYQSTLAQMAGMTKMQAVTDVLRAKTEALNKTLLKNPYVLIAAAVAAAAFGIYKLATATTDAEKAQKKLSKAYSDYETQVGAEIAQLDTMFARLKAAKEGTEEYKSAKEAINQRYGSYLDNQSKEIQSLKDIKGAYEAIKTAAEEAAKAQAMSSYMGEAAKDYSESVTEAKNDLFESLQKKYGNKVGDDGVSLVETYYWKIVPVLEGKEVISEDMQDIVNSFDKQHTLGGISWVSNEVKKILDDTAKARKNFNDISKEAQKLFGEGPTSKKTPTVDQNNKGEKQDKEYWENRKKTLQAQYEALTTEQLKTKEALKLQSDINQAEEQIEKYNLSKVKKDSNNEALQTAERKKKINESKEKISLAVRQAELEIAQTTVDALEEGVEKQIQQIDINYQRLIVENDKRREEWLQQLRDQKELEWEQANPKAKEQGKTFDRDTITDADFTDEQKNALQAFYDYAESFIAESNAKLLKGLLSDYRTYSEQRAKIEKEFADKIAFLYTTNEQGDKVLKKGVSEGNVKEITDAMNKALFDLEMKYSSTFKTIFSDISKMSRKQISEAIAAAEEALNNTNDIEQISILSNRLTELRNTSEEFFNSFSIGWESVAKVWVKLQQAQKDYNTAVAKGNTNRIKELEGTRQRLAEELKKNFAATGADTFVNSLQEAAKAMQQIADISGNIQLADSAAVLSSAAQNLSSAGKGAASGGWIGAIIGGVTDIISQTINSIVSAKEYVTLLKQELSSFANSMKLMKYNINDEDYKSIFGVTTMEKAQDAYHKAEEALQEYNAVINKTFSMTASKEKTISWGTLLFGGGELTTAAGVAELMKANSGLTLYQQQLSALNKGYTSLQAMSVKVKEQSGWAKFFGKKDEYQSLKDFAPQLWDTDGIFNVDAAKELLQASSKLTQEQKEQIEYAIELTEKYEDAKGVIESISADVIGNIANGMTDAIFTAIEHGAGAWSDFEMTAAEAIKNIASMMLNEWLIQGYLNQYKDGFIKALGMGDTNGMIDIIGKIAEQMPTIYEQGQALVRQLYDEAEQRGIDMDLLNSTSRVGSSKGITTASQDTVDELNGRATAIQGHTFSIAENTRNLVVTTSQILSSVMRIENHTERINDRMEDIETSIRETRSTVNDIYLKGVRMN